ncbi:MAG: endonuclease/exonuclease/phosphatase family protein [Acidobacteria bacterium]|nr:endonuclease/exonuclease/phosphatase family protein [Acidobacteriota bacterium]
MKIVTYNVHKCRGLDSRTDAQRIGEVLRGIHADIIALQEIFSSKHSNLAQAEYLASKLHLHLAFGRTRHLGRRRYGNAVLSRWPILNSEVLDISWRRREKRACLRADVDTPFGMVHVFNIHLGTSYFERRHQVRSLFALPQLNQTLFGPRVLIGDFNDWTRGLATRMLAERFESLNMQLHVRRRRSYPGFFPLLHLDHIYFEKPLHIEKAELVQTRLAKVASDHLPLVATFFWGTENQETLSTTRTAGLQK